MIKAEIFTRKSQSPNSQRLEMFKTVVCLAIFGCAAALPLQGVELDHWKNFKLEHNKSYGTEVEEEFRAMFFMENLKKVHEHNAKFEMGLTSFRLKTNKYSDMLHSERVAKMTGLRPNLTSAKIKSRAMKFVKLANVQVADQVDWRDQGAVTGVKDQGQCGSCWAFSSTGALEGQHFRQKGSLISLSEQNLVDCTMDLGNNGCNGGNMDIAFYYVLNNKGIDTEDSYPYEAQNDNCRYDASNSGADDQGWYDIPQGDEEALRQAVATAGPIAVGIDASQDSFGQYSSGVYDEPNCNPDNMVHAVLVVGFGNENGQDYWLVKNSWGNSWGDNGYIKMSRNKGNQCGITTMASYPQE